MKSKKYIRENRWLIVLLCLSSFILIWYLGIVPSLLKLPDNFEYSSDVVSYDNFYDSESQSFSGKQQSKTEFIFTATQSDGRVANIQNTFDVRTLEGDPIFTVSRQYGVNQFTGRHVVDAGDRDRSGYLFGPRMKGIKAQVDDKSSFMYWHVNYDSPIQMEFVREEVLLGLPVYVYESSFVADQTEELGDLPEVGETLGMRLDVDMTLWIEPYTGYLVNYQDFATASYYELVSGQIVEPWNQFENTFASFSVDQQTQTALLLKDRQVLFAIVIPMIVLGMIFFVGVFRLLVFLVDRGILSKRCEEFIFPVIIGLISFTITLVLTWYVFRSVEQDRQANFEVNALRINDDIEDRLEIYTNALFSARGLFDASEEVSREEWAAYIDSLAIQRNYPGIQGIGYSVSLNPDELNSHIAQIRAEGFPEYSVRPEGERDEYSAIVYLEPFDKRNQQAFGFDMFQNPIRQDAMIRARDNDTFALSGKVTLVQEIDDSDVQSGFLIYVPLYRKGLPTGTIEERRDALEGYVYSPFRMNDFVFGVVAANEGLRFEVFDTSDPGNLTAQTRMFGEDYSDAQTFSVMREIDFGGRTWLVRYTAGEEYGISSVNGFITSSVFVGGLILSLMIFFTIYILNTREKTARVLADEITQSLEIEKKRLSYIIDGANLGTWQMDIPQGKMLCNDFWADMLGLKLEAGKISVGEFEDLVHPDDLSERKRLLNLHYVGKNEVFVQKTRLKKSDGSWIWVHIKGKVLVRDEDGDPQIMFGVHQDITQQRIAEEELEIRAEELERMNKMMVDRELKMVELKKNSKGQ